MVKTGARADALKAALIEAGLGPAPPPPRPSLSDLPDELAAAVLELYRELGGSLKEPRLGPGKWDLSFEGPLAVELDEELHFNRYRALTLSAPWSEDLPWTEAYLAYCDAWEDECLAAGSWGKRWTNSSCERHFGTAGPAKELSGAGAPRWKQRALYDSIKDLAPAVQPGLRLARLSVYDKVGEESLGDLLYGPLRIDASELADLLETRTV